jgi:hypothetical protein
MSPGAFAGKAHEHGVARLELGVEAGRITLNFELPLESLAGFERAPRTDAERAAMVAALSKLEEAGKLLRVDAAAGCGPAKVSLSAPVWGVGGAANAAPGAAAAAPPPGAASKPAAAAKAREEHADLEALYEFRCSNSDRGTFVELSLFDAFARLQRIEVQAVTARGQMKLVLKRPQKRVGLVR